MSYDSDQSTEDNTHGKGKKFAVIVVTADDKTKSQRTFLVVLNAESERSADKAAMNTVKTLFDEGIWDTMFLPYPTDLNYGVVEIDFPVGHLNLTKVASTEPTAAVDDDPLDLRMHM